MRRLAIVALLMLPIVALADEATCYSSKGKTIYQQKIKNIQIMDSIISFEEIATKKLILTSSDCIITIDTKSKLKTKAKKTPHK